VVFLKALFVALYSSLYTLPVEFTPLNTLISSLPFYHHLYADDTQHFFSFHPLNFDSTISHLENALQQISLPLPV